MSFHVEFYARSRIHARRLLELHKSSLPAPVMAFLSAAIDGVPPHKEGAARILKVHASGHLCGGSDYEVSSADISVTPIAIPD